MHVKGWVKSTLLDFPGQVATSLFCGGCNLRCPNCHNRDLVLRPQDVPDIPESELWPFLEKRHGVLDGVVISGGEPTLQVDLAPFCERVRGLGFLVKLDTNGCRPDVVHDLLRKGLVDYIAMDVKAPPAKYSQAAGVAVDIRLVQRSITLLFESQIEYEFRTTVVPGLLECDDIVEIARWISGAKRYALQQFIPRNTLDPDLLDLTPTLPEKLHHMANLARQYVDEVLVRGV